MPKYKILANPGHNSQYFRESNKLSMAELTVYLGSQDIKSLPEECFIGRAPAVYFECPAALDENQIAGLYRLSFCYTVFEEAKGG